MADDAGYDAARRRGAATLRGPRALAVHYDAARDRVIIALSTGIELGLIPRDVEGLHAATPAQLADAVVEREGLALHWPTLDADLYLPALLDGALGSRRWMAARLGAEGGKSRSEGKAAAARANGKRGGRPRKTAA